jgi:hypothetical protein
MQLPPELRAKLEQSLGFRLNDIEERALELARGADPGELTALEAELVVQLASKLKEPWLSRPGRYLLAAQDELYRGRGGPLANWAKAFAAFLGLAGLLSFCGWLFGEFDLRSLAPLGLLHLFAAPISLLANYERRRMLKLVETELPRSNIIERLGDNDPALLEIQAHTPVPFRWLLNTRLGTGRAAKIDLAAKYLDWYLRPPGRLFRWSWVLPLAVGGALLACLANLGGYLGMSPTVSPWYLRLLAVPLAIWLGMKEVDLRLYFTDYLLAEIMNRIHARHAAVGPLGAESGMAAGPGEAIPAASMTEVA